MKTPPFHVVFEEHGGYDAMTSAYHVLDSHGKTLVSVDVADYTNSDDWTERHVENEKAKNVAMRIAELFNT